MKKSQEAEIEKRLRDLMRHALGMDSRDVPYRNAFVAHSGSRDASDWEALVGAGLATRGTSHGNFTYYHVTEKAAKNHFGIGTREFKKLAA